MKYTTSFIVFPKHCNNLKDLIFGGAFMAELDLAAAHCVRKALDGSELSNAVTHKADFEFKKPTYVGDYLELEAKVVALGTKSISVEVTAMRGVEVIAIGKFVFITIDTVESLEHRPQFLPYRAHGLAAIEEV